MRGLMLVVALAMLATPAMADWRVFKGKTIIVEVRTSGRSVTDTITARGGASTEDSVGTNNCDMTYQLYLSGKGRLFMFLSRIACEGSDPYEMTEASGTIIDLATPEGRVDAGPDSPRTPYSVSFSGDEAVIDQPQTDYQWKGQGYVSTFTNSSGLYTTRIRFADDCSMSVTGKASFRMEYRSTDSDYYVLQDTDSTYDQQTVSCRVVDGFVAK